MRSRIQRKQPRLMCLTLKLDQTANGIKIHGLRGQRQIKRQTLP